ncbi:hypothetical protein WDU99_07875 [Microbacterium sp. Mu-80]|uniref:Response regulator n=1 Tax=Microbacterium bandirmense TaxID=3122050 RepID=A0ABU8LB36_9MICO
MYMSAELIAILSCFATLGIGMFAGFAWAVRRSDSSIERLDTKLSTRIDAVGAEVTEVKIAVARLEGPPRHLLSAR